MNSNHATWRLSTSACAAPACRSCGSSARAAQLLENRRAALARLLPELHRPPGGVFHFPRVATGTGIQYHAAWTNRVYLHLDLLFVLRASGAACRSPAAAMADSRQRAALEPGFAGDRAEPVGGGVFILAWGGRPDGGN